jgi:hypothetical protein
MIRHLLATSLVLLLATGCDLTGQYEKELQKSAQTAGQRAVFDLNLHPAFTEVVDSAKQNIGVKLRIPKVFDSNSKALAANDPKNPLPIPGLTYSQSLRRQQQSPRRQRSQKPAAHSRADLSPRTTTRRRRRPVSTGLLDVCRHTQS